ncbi:MAG: class II aldolase [Phycisphaerae bacterium]|nr:class II aldolase [Phycisphaerae bacterium]
MLKTITELSHEFGTGDYVRGGGGNSSAKDARTLWVKSSGTTLDSLTPESLVATDRKKLAQLYETSTPPQPDAREALVKEMMLAAVRPDSRGRPSVEAPLHNAFEATFIVHTHPAMVNGMTCAADGADVCRTLFPDALWIDYTDPGYTLCMRVREEVAACTARRGKEPTAVFLASHGVFVAGPTAEVIRKTYTSIMDRLGSEYRKAGIPTQVTPGPMPPAETIETVTHRLRELLGEAAAHVCASGPFPVATGPITPDHMVYAKAYPLIGPVTAGSVAEFRTRRGYPPQVVACDEGVFGVGAGEKAAALALELALDGARVVQLAEAFGGIRHLSGRARDFIENWEVEQYRLKIIASD